MADSGFALTPAQREFLDTALASNYSAWVGARVAGIDRGHVRMTFRPRAEMLTPWNTLNGSVMNSVVEIPSFVALLTELAEGELPVTSDIFIQHVRAMPGDAEYVLEGRLLRRGRTMAWTEVTASVDGKAITYARVTKSIVARQ
ncbi:MAG: PaaI family thioesterase [Novosphingobium sp.]|nr:PaaI family thioesterase [Novosphingobium sp.]